MGNKGIVALAVVFVALLLWFQGRTDSQVESESPKALPAQSTEPSSAVRLRAMLKVEPMKLVPPPDNFANTKWQWQTKEYDDDWCLLEELTPSARQTAAMAYRDYREATGYVEHERRDGEHGFHPVDTGYDSYDVDILVKLSSQGDLVALTHLEALQISEEYNRWSYLTSYLYGGTALANKHFIENSFRAEYSLEKSENHTPELLAAAKRKMIEGLSFAFFAIEARGDRSGISSLDYLIKSQNSNIPSDVTGLYPITAEDIAQARGLGQGFLAEVNRKRKELGIGGELQPAGQKIHSSANRSLAWRIANEKEDVTSGLIDDLAVPTTACFENTVAMFKAAKKQGNKIGMDN